MCCTVSTFRHDGEFTSAWVLVIEGHWRSVVTCRIELWDQSDFECVGRIHCLYVKGTSGALYTWVSGCGLFHNRFDQSSSRDRNTELGMRGTSQTGNANSLDRIMDVAPA
jgi:hypothetical protein